VIVLGALVGLWFAYREQIEGLLAYSFSIGDLLLVAALFALGYLAPKLGSVFQALRALRTPAQVAVQFVGLFVVAVAGSWLIALHLAIFDFLFLRNGRIEKLGPPPNQ
jgi:type II secretory pathway component PulF